MKLRVMRRVAGDPQYMNAITFYWFYSKWCILARTNRTQPHIKGNKINLHMERNVSANLRAIPTNIWCESISSFHSFRWVTSRYSIAPCMYKLRTCNNTLLVLFCGIIILMAHSPIKIYSSLSTGRMRYILLSDGWHWISLIISEHCFR